MLELRHLHSHNMRKEKQLKVCNIVATFDFNGLSFFNTGNKRKGDSCVSMHVAADEDFNKKIRLNDVASRFHTVGSAKKSEDVKTKACGEQKVQGRSSISAICNGELDKKFNVGKSNNDHPCMSYATFKEKYEMSMTNIAKYAEHLEQTTMRDTENATPKQTITTRKTDNRESLPFVTTPSVKSFNTKGKKLATKFNEEKGSKGKLRLQGKLKKKPVSNAEGKKSKSLQYIEKQDNSNETHGSTPLTKQYEACRTPRGDENDITCSTLSDSVVNETSNETKSTPKVFKTPVSTVEHLFACHICTDSFVSQNTLDMHLKYDHRPRPTCSQCLKMFDCRRKLIDHEANCSSSGSPVAATATQSLGGIIDFISPDEVFFCVKCENPFPSKNVLRQHKILLNKRKPIALELTEESPSPNYFKNELWEICVKKMPSYSAPPTFDNDYNKCGYCEKSFQNIRRFKQHSVFCNKMKRILSERECVYCKKSFRNTETRDRHTCYCTKRTHGISLLMNVDYSCGLCNLVMKHLTDYNLHLQLCHDQRYCCKCNEMYAPDTVNGLKHECVILNQRVDGNAETVKVITDKNEKSIIHAQVRKRKRVSKVIVADMLNKVIIEDMLVNGTVRGNNSLALDALDDKISIVKENIPMVANKVDPSIVSKYERRTPRIIQLNKVHSPPTRKSNSYHCIFCPDRSFIHRSGLDAHLRTRHNKTQCEYCGDIFRCNTFPYHDCTKSKEVNNNTFENNAQDSYTVPTTITYSATTPISNPVNDNKNEVDGTIEIVDSDSSQTTDILAKTPKTTSQTYNCYKCAKGFSQRHFMIKHLVIHSKRNPYKCKYCRRLFKIPQHIDDHMKNMHYPHTYTHRKPIVKSLMERHCIKKCHICMNFFLGIADLKSHQKESHDLLNEISNEASMCTTPTSIATCHLCRKTSISANLVKHSSGSELICKSCSFALKSGIFGSFEASSLNDIRKTRPKSNAKSRHDYECQHCLQVFESQVSFDEHDLVCVARRQTFEENELMKPLIPTAESCLFEFNFSDQLCKGDVLTFEEAQATLQSLDVNYCPTDDDLQKSRTESDKSSSLVICIEGDADVVGMEMLSPSSSGSLTNVSCVNTDTNLETKNTNIIHMKDVPGILKSMEYENKSSEQNVPSSEENNTTSELRLLRSFQIYPCRICNVNFDSLSSLNYHMKASHQKESDESNTWAPLRVDVKHRVDRLDQVLTDVESSRKILDNFNFRVDKEKQPELIPSPNGSPLFETTLDRIAHYVPKTNERSLIKENKCPLNCRSNSSRHPCGNCSVIDSIKNCPVHKDYSSSNCKVSPDFVSKNSSRHMENGVINDKETCNSCDKETCKCCNLKFVNNPQFINQHLPKQKKYVFYPGEYPTALLRKYLPHPPTYITYSPKVSEEVINTYQTLDLFHSPYHQTSTVHHRPPPYLYDELTRHPENNVLDSRYFEPFNTPKLPKNRKRRSKVDDVEETKNNSPMSPPSPTCDVNVVVDLLKPLSPKSLEKSLQNGSRPKYTKSEVALKMTRLADTLGRKFGARFKRNALDIMKDLPQSN